MRFVVTNILDLLETVGEKETIIELETFSCPRNPEIEDFLVRDAIDFAKRKMSITYLINDAEDGSLLGYFTLANKALEIKQDAISKNLSKKVNRYGTLDSVAGLYTVHSYLLAQFGKNYAVESGYRIHAHEMMKQVDEVISRIQHLIGGGLIYLDVEIKRDSDHEHKKLTQMYHNTAGFVEFNERHSIVDGKDYVMMLKAV